MKKIFVSVSIMLMLLILISACTSEKGSDQQQGQQQLANLRIGVSNLPKNMDPVVSVGNDTIRVQYNIFETLIQADQLDGFKLKPMLAESWERIDDYTVEMKLRKGVKFHNGDELTAKDVAFSFARLKEDIQGVDLARSLLSVIETVEVLGDYELRLITSVVDPILEDRVASSWGGWIVPEKYINEVGNDGFADMPVGTGPYKVVEITPEKVLLERFDDYWGEKPLA